MTIELLKDLKFQLQQIKDIQAKPIMGETSANETKRKSAQFVTDWIERWITQKETT